MKLHVFDVSQLHIVRARTPRARPQMCGRTLQASAVVVPCQSRYGDDCRLAGFERALVTLGVLELDLSCLAMTCYRYDTRVLLKSVNQCPKAAGIEIMYSRL